MKDTSTKNIAIISTNMARGASHSGYIMIYDKEMNFLREDPLPGSEESDGWNIAHDIVNIVQYDLNNDGLLDLILTDNGNFRLSERNNKFTVLINQGDFKFIDKTSDYFPEQKIKNYFGYYTRILQIDGKLNLFIGNANVGSTIDFWKLDGGKFTPQMSDLFTIATRSDKTGQNCSTYCSPDYAFITPYRTKSGALNLVMVSKERLDQNIILTRRLY